MTQENSTKSNKTERYVYGDLYGVIYRFTNQPGKAEWYSRAKKRLEETTDGYEVGNPDMRTILEEEAMRSIAEQ